MNCFCCRKEVSEARKAKVREWVDLSPLVLGDTPEYERYKDQMTFRWWAVCFDCYQKIDNVYGMSEISGKRFNMSSTSRNNKATTIDEGKYFAWEQRVAAKHGIELIEVSFP